MGKFTNLNRIKEQAKLTETLADRVNGDTVRHCEALKDYPYYSNGNATEYKGVWEVFWWQKPTPIKFVCGKV